MDAMGNHHSSLTVGRVARLGGVGVPTLRFYERAGLLPKPARTSSNYRVYSAEAVKRVRFIRRAQQLGFTLKEIHELLALRVSRRANCAQVRLRAERKIADIEARIKSLQQMSRALTKFADECETHSRRVDCPLLQYLEGELSHPNKTKSP
jgi:MerR family transcriptional regulator, copper efflux regulator